MKLGGAKIQSCFYLRNEIARMPILIFHIESHIDSLSSRDFLWFIHPLESATASAARQHLKGVGCEMKPESRFWHRSMLDPISYSAIMGASSAETPFLIERGIRGLTSSVNNLLTLNYLVTLEETGSRAGVGPNEADYRL